MTAARRGALLICAAALLWSTAGIGIKTIDEPPLKVAFFRSAFAAVALFALLRPRLPRWTAGFTVALVSYAACLTTFVVATKWTTAANAIFLQYSGVVWVLLLSPVVLKEPFRPRDAIAVVVALGGMALFFVGKFRAGGAGDAMALLSGVLFASLILSLRSERDSGAAAAVTWGNVLACAALLPFVAGDLSLSGRSAVILGLLGVFQIAAAYALFVRGLKFVTATQASLVGMLEPVANPLWVFLFLGERPGAPAIAGGIVVLGAIAWRTIAAGPPAGALPPPE
ncbi:MAG: DMT family transporter [Acidobacteriota bacterium]|nr:DMT family transporter [Acidobacteriota bacterium]